MRSMLALTCSRLRDAIDQAQGVEHGRARFEQVLQLPGGGAQRGFGVITGGAVAQRANAVS
jgi:hypothetical protein